MFFVGRDVQAMWAVLEPVLAKAPAVWETVELRRGLEDPAPVACAADSARHRGSRDTSQPVVSAATIAPTSSTSHTGTSRPTRLTTQGARKPT